MNSSTAYLDGNAAAGPLGEFLGFDISAAVGRCAGCQGRAVMAQGRVYSAGPGLVLRCTYCDHVLVRLVTTKMRAWLDMSGLASLQFDRPRV